MRLASESSNHRGLDAAQPPLRLLPRGVDRRLADLHPTRNEILGLRRRSKNHRLDASALPVPEDDQTRNFQHPDPEFESSASAVVGGVRIVRRDERRDVADYEQFPGDRAEDHLGIDARIRARDDQRLRALSPMGERLVARPLGRPHVGAKSAVAIDQRVHGLGFTNRAKCCTAIGRLERWRKEPVDLAIARRACRDPSRSL